MEAVVPGSLGQQYRRPDGGHQTHIASLVCVSFGLQGSPGVVGHPANLELTQKDKVGGAHASRSMVHLCHSRRGGAGVQAVGAKAGSRQTERVARTALGLIQGLSSPAGLDIITLPLDMGYTQ